MQKSFPGFKQRTDAELQAIWNEGIFAFDASALLDLYRVTDSTRATYFAVLQRLKNRIWLPHQSGLEYHDNRIEVINQGLSSYDDIPNKAREAASQFRKGLDRYRQYRWVAAERWSEILERAAKEIEDTLAKEKRQLEDYATTDPIEQQLNVLFNEKVGSPFEDLHEVYLRAEQRIQLSVPPGYEDAGKKKNFHRYGDVLIWFQLLDYGKVHKKPIMFVTSDAKTDWWLERSGKTIGPRPELAQEMHTVAGVAFHMYSPDRFLEYAQLEEKLSQKKLAKAARELREVEAEKTADSISLKVRLLANAALQANAASQGLALGRLGQNDIQTAMAEMARNLGVNYADFSEIARSLKVNYPSGAEFLRIFAVNSSMPESARNMLVNQAEVMRNLQNSLIATQLKTPTGKQPSQEATGTVSKIRQDPNESDEESPKSSPPAPKPDTNGG